MHQTRPTQVLGIILCSLLSGGILWFWIFALAFTRSYADFWASFIWPSGFLIISVGIIAILAKQYWFLPAIFMPLPLALMNLSCFSMVYCEGQGLEWAYLWAVAAVVGLAWASSFVGWVIGYIVFGPRGRHQPDPICVAGDTPPIR